MKAALATLTGTLGDDLLMGTSGDDILLGLAGDDTLRGAAGNDRLAGGPGTDLMCGDAGDDTYLRDDERDQLLEAAGGGIDTVLTALSYSLPAEIENATVTGTRGRALYGNDLANLLAGNEGLDRLYGGAGNDVLRGLDRNDELFGGAGNDTLFGGDGRDMLTPGLGLDRIDGGNGQDTLVASYANNAADTAPVAVNQAAGWITAGMNRIVFTTVERFDLTGGRRNDRLEGGNDADTLDGGAGHDTLIGGFGADTYYVDSRFDTILEAASADYFQGDLVVAATSIVMPDHVERGSLAGHGYRLIGRAAAETLAGNERSNELLAGGGNDTVSGGGGDDRVLGGAGADQLSGGDGQDTLTGGAGWDILLGNAGIDTFRYLQMSDSNGGTPQAPLELGHFDHIDGFSLADGDRLDLSLLDADTTRAGDQDFVFVARFSGTPGELTYSDYILNINGSDDDQVIDTIVVDVDGDGATDFSVGFFDFATASLTAANFIL